MDLEGIALRMMTIGITIEQITAAGWELRKGKTMADLKKAQEKAKKHGNLKTEYELEFCGVYLYDILKKIRQPRVNKSITNGNTISNEGVGSNGKQEG